MATFTFQDLEPFQTVDLNGQHQLPQVVVLFNSEDYEVEDAWARIYFDESDGDIPAGGARCSPSGDSPHCRNDATISDPTVEFANLPCPSTSSNRSYYLKVWLLKNVGGFPVLESAGVTFTGVV